MTDASRLPVTALSERVPDMMPGLRTDIPPEVERISAWLVPIAVVGLWVRPARFGPRLAALGWRFAVLANLTAITIASGLIIAVEISGSRSHLGAERDALFSQDGLGPVATLAERVRGPYAAIVLAALNGRPNDVEFITAVPFLAALTEPALPIIAVLIMPLVAAGEPLRRLYRRCLRLTLWSTTLAIPVALAWKLLLQAFGLAGLEERTLSTLCSCVYWGDAEGIFMATIALVPFLVWWFVVLIRSGSQYAGSAEGPGWEPRLRPRCEPRCHECDYILYGLAVSGRCPECGTPVAESMAAMEKANEFTHWRAFKLAVGAAISRGRGEG